MAVHNLFLSVCFSCNAPSVWHGKEIIYPETEKKHEPNPDLPDDIKRDFVEADMILAVSPRGSAALLQLCVQKICKHLDRNTSDLNTAIGALVKRGLHPNVQAALDIVRVTGNNAVHPGEIDIDDSGYPLHSPSCD